MTAKRRQKRARRLYQACPTRSRRTKAQIGEIKSAIREVLGHDHPMTVRQVFYQLVVRQLIEKTETEYQRTVIRLLTEMRLDGQILFSWIVDETRQRRITETYDSIADAVRATAMFYRRSALRACSVSIEIWVEKDALSGVLWDVTSEYDVPLMVSRGMPSLTFLHGTAQEIYRAAEQGKQTYIYQFGDHDPSGVLIPKTIESRLDQFCQKLDCPPPHFERVALTEEQIAEFDLPTRPTKRIGNSHATKFEGDSVELDALSASELRSIVRQVIERHISGRQLATLRVAEESEREVLEAWADQVAPDGAAP